MTLKKIILLLTLSISISNVFGQSELQVQNIGDFITTSKDTIKNCKIGYRTLGTLNANKSNVLVMPTWHLGTSEDNLDYLKSIIDTKGYYIIVVDALGNGVSSSPSNTVNFPDISIRDMVNSQYDLLVNHLKIEHIDLLIGVSMGGMQALEWMVAYPEFMTQLVAINGTTKASFYDKALWNTIVTLIEDAGNDKEAITYAMQRVQDISLLTGTSPSFVSQTYEAENFEEFITKRYNQPINSFNKLAQSKAILEHDIYKNNNINSENIVEWVKTKVFIIVSEQDHIVNPMYSRALSEILDCDILELTGDCGHVEAFCDPELVKQALSDFLKH